MTKITMVGKYALRQDPYTPVRILCVDRPKDHTVVAMTSTGRLMYRYPNGSQFTNSRHQNDLVPLQEKPKELWVATRANGEWSNLKAPSKELIEEKIKKSGSGLHRPYTIHHMREVISDET